MSKFKTCKTYKKRMFAQMLDVSRGGRYLNNLKKSSSKLKTFARKRLLLLTKNALLEKGPKKLASSAPPLIIEAMPKRKHYFSIDVFP